MGSCLRRNDGVGGAGVTGVGMMKCECALESGVATWALVDARGTPTTHLASPLEGGRDEFGRGWGMRCVGSCLCGNDGEGSAEVLEIGWCALAGSHPPPSLPLVGGRDELGTGGRFLPAQE